MNNPISTDVVDGLAFEPLASASPGQSAVSLAAIFAGAAATAALSLILLILGTGLGLSSLSPWAHEGISAAGLGMSTILWVTLTQILASGLGGYLAGRLRTRWRQVHADEVYFRDTAHGLLAWSVASLATAALLGSVIGSIVHSGVQSGASLAGGAAGMVTGSGLSAMAARGSDTGPISYFVDSLFRKNGTGPETNSAGDSANTRSAAEVTGIFMSTLRTGTLAQQDVAYVGQLVAARTGLSQTEAEQRVGALYSAAQEKLRAAETATREAADRARKASAYGSLWLFISLLAGAFVASFAATRGGRQRDQH